MIAVGTNGSRKPAFHWTLPSVEQWIREGHFIREVTA
jgi:hypothetical protein